MIGDVMTAFNTNMTSELEGRLKIGPSQIRSRTRYSDMFIGNSEDVIEAMVKNPGEFNPVGH